MGDEVCPFCGFRSESVSEGCMVCMDAQEGPSSLLSMSYRDAPDEAARRDIALRAVELVRSELTRAADLGERWLSILKPSERRSPAVRVGPATRTGDDYGEFYLYAFDRLRRSSGLLEQARADLPHEFHFIGATVSELAWGVEKWRVPDPANIEAVTASFRSIVTHIDKARAEHAERLHRIENRIPFPWALNVPPPSQVGGASPPTEAQPSPIEPNTAVPEADAQSASVASKSPKEPPREAFEAYALHVETAWDQSSVARKLSESLGRPISQGQVSRWVKAVREWREAGSASLGSDPTTRPKTFPVDPSRLDLGPRDRKVMRGASLGFGTLCRGMRVPWRHTAPGSV